MRALHQTKTIAIACRGILILPNLSDKIDRAVQKITTLGGPKARFIILYGSAAEERLKEDSDIDISVYYNDVDASEIPA